MAGPYTFEMDSSAGTWRCINGNGDEISSGELPLTDLDRKKAIFSDHGVSDPTSTALIDIWEENWDDSDV